MKEQDLQRVTEKLHEALKLMPSLRRDTSASTAKLIVAIARALKVANGIEKRILIEQRREKRQRRNGEV